MTTPHLTKEVLEDLSDVAARDYQDDTICRAVTFGELRALLSERDRLRAALELTMVGGNHLAGVLVDRLGPGFAEHLEPDTPHEIALHALKATLNYEVWCCWSAIMRARQALNPTGEK